MGQRQSDFLIGEEPLDGEVGFFAASADADPPAAADPIAETTPGPQAGPLPAGRRPGRGSAVALPPPWAWMRPVAAGLLVASCAALAAIVAFSAPTKPTQTSQPRPDGGKHVRPDRHAVGADYADRSSDAPRRGRFDVAAAPVRAYGRSARVRREPRQAISVEWQAPPLATAAQTARTAAVQPSAVSAGPAGGVEQATPGPRPRSEFDFER